VQGVRLVEVEERVVAVGQEGRDVAPGLVLRPVDWCEAFSEVSDDEVRELLARQPRG
jgi:hypothetical protein